MIDCAKEIGDEWNATHTALIDIHLQVNCKMNYPVCREEKVCYGKYQWDKERAVLTPVSAFHENAHSNAAIRMQSDDRKSFVSSTFHKMKCNDKRTKMTTRHPITNGRNLKE